MTSKPAASAAVARLRKWSADSPRTWRPKRKGRTCKSVPVEAGYGPYRASDAPAGLLHDRFLQLLLLHLRSPWNLQLPGLLAQLGNGGLRAHVIAAGRHPMGGTIAGCLRIRRPAMAFRYPAVS